MRRILLILTFCYLKVFITFGQTNIDSLNQIIINPDNSDSIKAITYNNLALALVYNNPDKAFENALKAKEISQNNGYEQTLLDAIDHIARIWWIRGQLDSSLFYINKKLKIYEELGNELGISASLNNLGMISENKGNFPQALTLYIKSIKILEALLSTKTGDTLIEIKGRLASTYNNAGNIYARQNDINDARRYYQQALDINLELNSERKIAVNNTNLGILDYQENKYHDAIKKYHKALEIHTKFNDKYGMAEVQQNLGHSLVKLHKLSEAESSYLKAVKLQEELEDLYGLCSSYRGLSDIHFMRNDIEKALSFANKTIAIAEENDFKETIFSTHGQLASIYYSIGEYKKAYQELKTSNSIKDSVFSLEKDKQMEQLKTIYETDKKEKEIALLNKDKAIKAIELEAKDQTIKQQNTKMILYIVAAILLLIATTISLRNVQIKKKANKEILEQKHRIEEANEELNQQNEEIMSQRDLIEEQKSFLEHKNQQLVDGINAAERIQRAFFTYEEKEKQNLPEHFVVFQPLGIVSGDFYWFQKQYDILYLAIVDCTGHGVSGALMSMLGASSLTEIVSFNNEITPAEVLELLSEKIVKELNQSAIGSTSREGMDIALIALNTKTNKAQFAGANNPLYIIRNNTDEVEIIKGNRRPIGYSDNSDKFNNNVIELNKGDLIYMFSDGYADQFGGLNSKKMGYKLFRDKLLEIKNLNLDKQKTRLEEYLSEWKGNEEQLDDICIMGLKI